jgi:hypothetical protein
MKPEDLVTEEPVAYGGHTWTARRNAAAMNPGTVRWQVFREDGSGPAGYLEAVYQPTESVHDHGWEITVSDPAGLPVGEQGRHAAPGTVPAVSSYRNALAWLLARERGDT